MADRKLTAPQIELLTDIATKPQMYIDRNRRWSKTAQALITRELAFEVRPGSYYRHYEIRITEKGRAEATRLGITASGSKKGEEA